MSFSTRPVLGYRAGFFSRSLAPLLAGLLAALLFAAPARAEEFFAAVDLGPLKIATTQDNATLKTLDTYARQKLSMITGKSSLDGQPALPVVLDMTFRPELWEDRNIVRMKNVPLRQDFADFPGIDAAEKQRILTQGTVSLNFMRREDVQRFLEETAGRASFKANAVNELQSAAATLAELTTAGGVLPTSVVPPVVEGDRDWKSTRQIMASAPKYLAALRAQGIAIGAPHADEPASAFGRPLPGYENRGPALERVIDVQLALREAWRSQQPAAASKAAVEFAKALIDVNPVVYPAHIKRLTEYYYNRAAKLTIPTAFVYFAAFTLFLMSVYSGAGALRSWAMGLFVVAFVVHTLAIALRWWLVSKSVGNWFESIPIKNQFESVLFSSWFGGLVGLCLELFRGSSRLAGVWGAASSFVGWLSLVAIFSAPFVFGREIGGEIGMVNGVLMSYWLYIHVTMVTAAYALIGMSFMLGVWWLLKSRLRLAGGPAGEVLDSCNMVVLQLAFWLLGVGIILGAVWADQSWGRPWGWDPKETFALVTWIVYLAVVHIRLVTPDKAWWTSVLSVVGFFVMLFNWIGVNFFLVGLHSYA